MTVKLAPLWQDPWVDANGAPLSGYKLFTYTAGSANKLTTYTSSAGNVAQSNPIVLNSQGMPSSPIWLTAGLSYKFVLAGPNDTDPPVGATISRDDITGVNDTTSAVDQWLSSGLTPTYISATSFSFAGDQTATFQVGRRLKTTNSGGTIYSTITASAFGAVTTITVANDSGSLDSGLSAVSYGILSATNQSIPSPSWTSPDFSADNFTANGSMTWTVGSGDVTTYKYLIEGKSMTVAFIIATSTVGGTPSNLLQIAIPASKVATSAMEWRAGQVIDNGSVSDGYISVAASGTVIRIGLQTGSNWSASTNATYVSGTITFEIN